MMKRVPLVTIAHARSGDKGNSCNIGVIARRPEYYPLLINQLTVERVREHFKGWVHGAIARYEMPSIQAINFVLEEALGGGATASLRADNQGKTMGGALLRLTVDLPE
jgi:hypothetical protein